MRRPARRVLTAAVSSWLTMAGGCAPSWYAAEADREVERILTDFDRAVLGNRQAMIIEPLPLPEELPEETAGESPAAAAEEPLPDPSEPPLLVDLTTALDGAVDANRDYMTRRESLYRAGLGYSLVRYNFGPIMNATVGYLWSDREGGDADDSLTAAAGVSTILPTGGDLSVSGDLGGVRADDPGFLDLGGDRFYDSSVRATLSQPLLRGAGYEVSHEPLTQAERTLVYEVRDFELFREDFSILVAGQFYNLVRLAQRLENDRQNYEGAVFDHERSRVLKQLDRISDDDVFLARRREIDAEDRLLVSQTDHELALDDFKILLGLPIETTIEIRDTEPLFQAVRVESESAVAAAHHNRLDLRTQRDLVDDAERRVRVAANGLLPDLDLGLAYGFDGAGDDVDSALPDTWTTSIGATFDLPLDRQAERNAYRSALIDLDQSRRELQQRLDEVERDILNQIRALERIEKQIDLQVEQIEKERRAVAISELRFDSGDVRARDLLDARQSLTDAQNALIDLKVQHFIARLVLLRNMGVLFIDENGMWR